MKSDEGSGTVLNADNLRQNRLLAAIPDSELHRLEPQLERVLPAPRQVIQAAGEPVEYVYFPTRGVFSLIAALPEGTTVEAVTVGDEGMLNIEGFFTARAVASGETMLQVPDGAVLRLSVEVFRRGIAEGGALAQRVGAYAQLVLTQIVLGAACNARHNLQDRCAKWLLLTHDRMHRDEFRLSHEVLATMLGATRQTVTIAAQTLQHAGHIAYTYGRVKVVDRMGLEQAACSCYQAIRRQFDTL